MNATMGKRFDFAWEDARWRDFGLKPLARAAARATLGELGLGRHHISILACDDARIAGLNAQFRGKPVPTNVLSWPAIDLSGKHGPQAPAAGAALGDIAIAWETCVREAADQGKPMAAHVMHLIVHATLHLLGYDHVRARDAAVMEGLEVKILASLGLSDPYQ